MTYDQIEFYLREGKPQKTGVSIMSPDDLPRAVEKMHKRKLREIFGGR